MLHHQLRCNLAVLIVLSTSSAITNEESQQFLHNVRFRDGVTADVENVDTVTEKKGLMMSTIDNVNRSKNEAEMKQKYSEKYHDSEEKEEADRLVSGSIASNSWNLFDAICREEEIEQNCTSAEGPPMSETVRSRRCTNLQKRRELLNSFSEQFHHNNVGELSEKVADCIADRLATSVGNDISAQDGKEASNMKLGLKRNCHSKSTPLAMERHRLPSKVDKVNDYRNSRISNRLRLPGLGRECYCVPSVDHVIRILNAANNRDISCLMNCSLTANELPENFNKAEYTFNNNTNNKEGLVSMKLLDTEKLLEKELLASDLDSDKDDNTSDNVANNASSDKIDSSDRNVVTSVIPLKSDIQNYIVYGSDSDYVKSITGRNSLKSENSHLPPKEPLKTSRYGRLNDRAGIQNLSRRLNATSQLFANKMNDSKELDDNIETFHYRISHPNKDKFFNKKYELPKWSQRSNSTLDDDKPIDFNTKLRNYQITLNATKKGSDKSDHPTYGFLNRTSNDTEKSVPSILRQHQYNKKTSARIIDQFNDINNGNADNPDRNITGKPILLMTNQQNNTEIINKLYDNNNSNTVNESRNEAGKPMISILRQHQHSPPNRKEVTGKLYSNDNNNEGNRDQNETEKRIVEILSEYNEQYSTDDKLYDNKNSNAADPEQNVTEKNQSSVLSQRRHKQNRRLETDKLYSNNSNVVSRNQGEAGKHRSSNLSRYRHNKQNDTRIIDTPDDSDNSDTVNHSSNGTEKHVPSILSQYRYKEGNNSGIIDELYDDHNGNTVNRNRNLLGKRPQSFSNQHRFDKQNNAGIVDKFYDNGNLKTVNQNPNETERRTWSIRKHQYNGSNNAGLIDELYNNDNGNKVDQNDTVKHVPLTQYRGNEQNHEGVIEMNNNDRNNVAGTNQNETGFLKKYIYKSPNDTGVIESHNNGGSNTVNQIQSATGKRLPSIVNQHQYNKQSSEEVTDKLFSNDNNNEGNREDQNETETRTVEILSEYNEQHNADDKLYDNKNSNAADPEQNATEKNQSSVLNQRRHRQNRRLETDKLYSNNSNVVNRNQDEAGKHRSSNLSRYRHNKQNDTGIVDTPDDSDNSDAVNHSRNGIEKYVSSLLSQYRYKEGNNSGIIDELYDDHNGNTANRNRNLLGKRPQPVSNQHRFDKQNNAGMINKLYDINDSNAVSKNRNETRKRVASNLEKRRFNEPSSSEVTDKLVDIDEDSTSTTFSMTVTSPHTFSSFTGEKSSSPKQINSAREIDTPEKDIINSRDIYKEVRQQDFEEKDSTTPVTTEIVTDRYENHQIPALKSISIIRRKDDLNDDDDGTDNGDQDVSVIDEESNVTQSFKTKPLVAKRKKLRRQENNVGNSEQQVSNATANAKPKLIAKHFQQLRDALENGDSYRINNSGLINEETGSLSWNNDNMEGFEKVTTTGYALTDRKLDSESTVGSTKQQFQLFDEIPSSRKLPNNANDSSVSLNLSTTGPNREKVGINDSNGTELSVRRLDGYTEKVGAQNRAKTIFTQRTEGGGDVGPVQQFDTVSSVKPFVGNVYNNSNNENMLSSMENITDSNKEDWSGKAITRSHAGDKEFKNDNNISEDKISGLEFSSSVKTKKPDGKPLATKHLAISSGKYRYPVNNGTNTFGTDTNINGLQKILDLVKSRNREMNEFTINLRDGKFPQKTDFLSIRNSSVLPQVAGLSSIRRKINDGEDVITEKNSFDNTDRKSGRFTYNDDEKNDDKFIKPNDRNNATVPFKLLPNKDRNNESILFIDRKDRNDEFTDDNDGNDKNVQLSDVKSGSDQFINNSGGAGYDKIDRFISSEQDLNNRFIENDDEIEPFISDHSNNNYRFIDKNNRTDYRGVINEDGKTSQFTDSDRNVKNKQIKDGGSSRLTSNNRKCRNGNCQNEFIGNKALSQEPELPKNRHTNPVKYTFFEEPLRTSTLDDKLSEHISLPVPDHDHSASSGPPYDEFVQKLKTPSFDKVVSSESNEVPMTERPSDDEDAFSNKPLEHVLTLNKNGTFAELNESVEQVSPASLSQTSTSNNEPVSLSVPNEDYTLFELNKLSEQASLLTPNEDNTSSNEPADRVSLLVSDKDGEFTELYKLIKQASLDNKPNKKLLNEALLSPQDKFTLSDNGSNNDRNFQLAVHSNCNLDDFKEPQSKSQVQFNPLEFLSSILRGDIGQVASPKSNNQKRPRKKRLRNRQKQQTVSPSNGDDAVSIDQPESKLTELLAKYPSELDSNNDALKDLLNNKQIEKSPGFVESSTSPIEMIDLDILLRDKNKPNNNDNNNKNNSNNSNSNNNNNNNNENYNNRKKENSKKKINRSDCVPAGNRLKSYREPNECVKKTRGVSGSSNNGCNCYDSCKPIMIKEERSRNDCDTGNRKMKSLLGMDKSITLLEMLRKYLLRDPDKLTKKQLSQLKDRKGDSGRNDRHDSSFEINNDGDDFYSNSFGFVNPEIMEEYFDVYGKPQLSSNHFVPGQSESSQPDDKPQSALKPEKFLSYFLKQIFPATDD